MSATPCRAEPEHWFYENNDAKMQCRLCPVRKACAESVLVNEARGLTQRGVYAGFYLPPPDEKNLRRRRLASLRHLKEIAKYIPVVERVDA